MSGEALRKVRVVLLAGLAEEAEGNRVVEVAAGSWREALLKLRERYPGLRRVINERGEPEAGYIVFVDGVDYRLRGNGPAKEIVVLPVNHGGVELYHVTWDEVEEAARIIADKISSDGWKPSVVVGVLRGGVVPARLVADYLGVDNIGVIEVKLYRGVGVKGDKPYVRQPLTLEVLDKDVLVVDDVSDSGLTLQVAVGAISLHGARAIRTATLYVKPWTSFSPDYYAFTTDKWVVFPWEKMETQRGLEGKRV